MLFLRVCFDASLSACHAQYGEDTGNTASTFHEVRTWRKQYETGGKPLIPLRMVSEVRALWCVVAALKGSPRADLMGG